MSATLPDAIIERRPSGIAALLEELRPRPGRLAGTLRLVVVVLVTVAIAETFRMPDVATSAYVVLFVSRDERSSTIMTAVIAGLAVIAAAFATAVLFMASLSEPAVRVPLIAAVTFVAMFLSRVSPLGPAAFAAGFIMAYGLTAGDEVLGVAVQSAGISNTTDRGLPELFFMPPEEALLQFVLWLAPAVALPVALVVVANLLTGQQPLQLLRTGLADRLAACAAFCAGEPGAARALAASARKGSAQLVKLLHSAGAAPQAADYASLIGETQQLALALLAWPMVAPAEAPQAGLRSCAAEQRAAEASLRPGGKPAVAERSAPEPGSDAARPLAAEIGRATAAIRYALAHPAAAGPKPPRAAGHLISADAVRNPETTRFALKVTLAVMLAYGSESLLDWPAIHTCVVTCFFVSLGTIGESVRKATLRIIGALIGGALGIGSILVLMPLMTDLGDLLLALAAVTMVAGWVACGSERISYAGWQIGLAYYLTMLQGYGPTIEMKTARDRVIGIVLGNVIVFVVFTIVWPVDASRAARRQVARAITRVAALMRLDQTGATEAAVGRQTLRAEFAGASNAARNLMANTDHGLADVWHAGVPRPIGPRALAELETIMVAVCVVTDLRAGSAGGNATDPARQAARAYRDALAAWLDRCADWVESGADAGRLEADIPAPPSLADPGRPTEAAWFGVLDRELRASVALIMRGTDRNG